MPTEESRCSRLLRGELRGKIREHLRCKLYCERAASQDDLIHDAGARCRSFSSCDHHFCLIPYLVVTTGTRQIAHEARRDLLMGCCRGRLEVSERRGRVWFKLPIKAGREVQGRITDSTISCHYLKYLIRYGSRLGQDHICNALIPREGTYIGIAPSRVAVYSR
ncbi:hypothetical protein F5Y14DRAFT_433865 [Nemania sp. NC0429]|nr:hypothetical protein F5Y14DRAFT_433865 [Nemania sp. NC0429]